MHDARRHAAARSADAARRCRDFPTLGLTDAASDLKLTQLFPIVIDTSENSLRRATLLVRACPGIRMMKFVLPAVTICACVLVVVLSFQNKQLREANSFLSK